MFIRSQDARGWSDSCERLAHGRLSDLSNGAKISGKQFELIVYAVGKLDGITPARLESKGISWLELSSKFGWESKLLAAGSDQKGRRIFHIEKNWNST
jgi:hypothetical protein